MNNNQKIGVCGLACFKCPKFAKKECPGCEPNEFCPLPQCADKGIGFCFKCKEFPCDLHYKKGPLQKDLLDFHKRKEN
jgi:hypothetical protein